MRPLREEKDCHIKAIAGAGMNWEIVGFTCGRNGVPLSVGDLYIVFFSQW